MAPIDESMLPTVAVSSPVFMSILMLRLKSTDVPLTVPVILPFMYMTWAETDEARGRKNRAAKANPLATDRQALLADVIASPWKQGVPTIPPSRRRPRM